MDYANGPFVDRGKELGFLGEVLRRKGFQLIPVWGRRRVGKTTLLLKALGGKGVFFIASESLDRDNLIQFRRSCAEGLNDPGFNDLELDWEIIFRRLKEKDAIVVMDEFPYLVASNPSLPSVFQRIVDSYLSRSEVKLFICGSSVRMMESSVLDYRAPLFGRRTGQVHLEEVPFKYLNEFLPTYSKEDLVRVYGITGGIPLYIKQFDPSQDIWDNIRTKVLSPNSILYYEPEFILRQEFLQSSTYRSVLLQVAAGRNTHDEIRNSLKMERSDLSSYLRNLITVGILRKEVPVTEDPLRSRMGRYFISDKLIQFNLKFVLGARSMIESGNVEGPLNSIKEGLDTYLGRIFESVAREAFIDRSGRDGVEWDSVGSWWYKEDEIDLVAFSKKRKELLLGEVKWSDRKIGENDLAALASTGEKMRGFEGFRRRYILISRGGFRKDLSGDEDTIKWTLKDLFK